MLHDWNGDHRTETRRSGWTLVPNQSRPPCVLGALQREDTDLGSAGAGVGGEPGGVGMMPHTKMVLRESRGKSGKFAKLPGRS